MVLTLKDAEIDKIYRIKNIVNMSLRRSKVLRVMGVVNGSKIRLIEHTSYDYYLFEAIHPNGELIKGSATSQEAERIHLEDEFNCHFTAIDVEDE